MANLAIRGHETRGKEVIEILEMLGGINNNHCYGVFENRIYIIDKKTDEIIDVSRIFHDEYNLFTLEEFLEKFPYKVGDKVHIPEYESEVRICKMRWYGFGDIEYLVYRNGDGEWYTAENLKEYNADFLMDKENGETSDNAIIDSLYKKGEKKSLLASLKEYFRTTPKEVLEREWNEHKELDEIGPTVEEYIDFAESFKKQPKYPQTYCECCEILQYPEELKVYPPFKADVPEYDVNGLFNLLETLRKLIICRGAYWKIAGEQMGLDKPWEPDWKDESESKYVICMMNNEVSRHISRHISTHIHFVLAFPTEEMRDAFYENFKDLIENCKELL